MDISIDVLRERVVGYEAILKQLRKTYLNPEMRAVIDMALEGRFEEALYQGFRNYKEIRNWQFTYDQIDFEGDGEMLDVTALDTLVGDVLVGEGEN